MITSRRSLGVLAVMAVAGLLICVSSGIAADAGSAGATVVQKGVTIKELVDRGGPMLIVLGLASVVGMALIMRDRTLARFSRPIGRTSGRS